MGVTAWFEGRPERPPKKLSGTSKEMYMDVTPQNDVSRNTAGQLLCWLTILIRTNTY